MVFKKFPSSRQLIGELENGKIYPIYLLIGEEEGEKDKCIQRIVQLAIPGVDSISLSTGNFHIEMDEFIQGVEFALSPSMFSAKKTCIMRNIDALPSSRENLDLLHELLYALPESHVIIMTSGKNFTPRFFKEEELTRARVYHFWKLFEKDLITYISDRLEKEQISIEPGAVTALLDLCGRDVRKIDEALDIMGCYTENGTITGETVKRMVTDQREVSLQDFVDVVFTGKGNVFGVLKKLLDNGIHELMILGSLIRRAEQFESYHALIAGGDSVGEALKKLSIPERKQKEFIAAAGENPPYRIKKMMYLLHRADNSIKSHRISREFSGHPLLELAAVWNEYF